MSLPSGPRCASESIKQCNKLGETGSLFRFQSPAMPHIKLFYFPFLSNHFQSFGKREIICIGIISLHPNFTASVTLQQCLLRMVNELKDGICNLLRSRILAK